MFLIGLGFAVFITFAILVVRWVVGSLTFSEIIILAVFFSVGPTLEILTEVNTLRSFLLYFFGIQMMFCFLGLSYYAWLTYKMLTDKVFREAQDARWRKEEGFTR